MLAMYPDASFRIEMSSFNYTEVIGRHLMSKSTLKICGVLSGILCFVAGCVSFTSNQGGNIDQLPLAFGFYFWGKGVFLSVTLFEKANRSQ